MDPDYLEFKKSNLSRVWEIFSYSYETLQNEFQTDPFLNKLVRYNHFWFDYANKRLDYVQFRDPSNMPLKLDRSSFSDWREVFLEYSEYFQQYFNIVRLSNIRHFRAIYDVDYKGLKTVKNLEISRILNTPYKILEEIFNNKSDQFVNELLLYDEFWFDYVNKHLPWARSEDSGDCSTEFSQPYWYDVFLTYNREWTFLDVLPVELFNFIILKVELDQILPILQNICKVYPARCSNESYLWTLLYKRDLDEEIPRGVTQIYLDFANAFNEYPNSLNDRFNTAIVFGAYNTLIKLQIPDKILLDESLIEALRKNNTKIFKYLADLGADIFSVTSLLPSAAALGNLEIVDYLIRRGIDVNDRDSAAIINAVRKRNINMVKFLIERGANKFIKDLLKDVAEDMSGSDEAFEIMKILIEANNKSRYDNNLLF